MIALLALLLAAGASADTPRQPAEGSANSTRVLARREGGAEGTSGSQGGGRLATLGAAREPAEGSSNDWTLPGKDAANTRYSSLKDINASNVGQLKVAWQASTGMTRGHEAAPLVVGNLMYVVTPYPNHVLAYDLSKPGGALAWAYKPDPNPASQGVACCDLVNRGASYADGKIFYNLLDNHTVALDAKTGKELWKVKLGEVNKGESITMAPLVAKGKVLVGNSGGEFGVRGWLTALDANTGKILWRAYSTGPDKDVLIGPGFKPHYESEKGKDLGVSTWPPGKWEIGGGTVWGFVSYDAQLDLLYYGTANPGPWNADQRPGDNKWTAGVFARRPDTGEAVWFYQYNPHDLWDHDGINELVLVDLEIGGKQRKVALHPDRNGLLYVLDRETGEVISANPFGIINTNRGVDLKTGKLQVVHEKVPGVGKLVRDACPAAPGAKDWQPSAWSPETKLLYIPHQNLCEDIEGGEANYIAGTPYVGVTTRFYSPPGKKLGAFTAWDPVQGKPAWQLEEQWPVWSGALATGGDLVFYGTMDGWFKAVHARTGQLLWQIKTPSGIIGQPVTFRGPDGKQRVAVLSGVGGWAGAVVSGRLDVRDGSAALGWGTAHKTLPQHVTPGGVLTVFELP